MLRTLLVGITLASTMSATNAADSIQFTCKGDMIEPAGLARAPKTLNVVFSPAEKVSKVSVDFGQGGVNAPVSSNNIIQLKFHTKDFTGEYFYYDRDMFLIYKSGHLARLTCAPS
jgi:hypothetical protein